MFTHLAHMPLFGRIFKCVVCKACNERIEFDCICFVHKIHTFEYKPESVKKIVNFKVEKKTQ